MTDTPLSTEEYIAQMRSFNEKTITLASGFTYRIKKLSTAESLVLMDKYTVLDKDARNAYLRMRDVNRDEKEAAVNIGDVLKDKLSPVQWMEMNVESTIACILEPKSPEVWVPELPASELTALIAECTNFCSEDSFFQKKTLTSTPNPSEPSDSSPTM